MVKKILLSIISISTLVISSFSFSTNKLNTIQNNNKDSIKNSINISSEKKNLSPEIQSKKMDNITELKTKESSITESISKDIVDDVSNLEITDFKKLYRVNSSNLVKYGCKSLSSDCLNNDNKHRYYFDNLSNSIKSKIEDDSNIASESPEDGIVSLTIQNFPLSGIVSDINTNYSSYDKQILLSSIIKKISFFESIDGDSENQISENDFNISSMSFNGSIFNNTVDGEKNFKSMVPSGTQLNNFEFFNNVKQDLSSIIDYLNFNYNDLADDKTTFGNSSFYAALNSNDPTESIDIKNFRKEFNKTPAFLFNNYISFTFNKPIKLSSVRVLLNSYKDNNLDDNWTNYDSVKNLITRNKFDEIGSIIAETSKNIVYRADNVALEDLELSKSSSSVSENSENDNYVEINLLPKKYLENKPIWSIYANINSPSIINDSIISLNRTKEETLDFWYDRDNKRIKRHVGYTLNDSPLRDYSDLKYINSVSDFIYSPIAAVDTFKYSTVQYNTDIKDYKYYFSKNMQLDFLNNIDGVRDYLFANSYSCFFDYVDASDTLKTQDLNLLKSLFSSILQQREGNYSIPSKDLNKFHKEDVKERIQEIYKNNSSIPNITLDFSGTSNNIDRCSVKNLKIFTNFLNLETTTPPAPVEELSFVSSAPNPYTFISVGDVDYFSSNFQKVKEIHLGNVIDYDSIKQETYNPSSSSGSDLSFETNYWSKKYDSSLYFYGTSSGLNTSFRNFSQSLETINLSNIFIDSYNKAVPIFNFNSSNDGLLTEENKNNSTQFNILRKNILPILRKGVKIIATPLLSNTNSLISNVFNDNQIRENANFYEGYIFDRLYYNRISDIESISNYFRDVVVVGDEIKRNPENTLIVLEKTAEQTYPQPSINYQDPSDIDTLVLDGFKIKPIVYSKDNTPSNLEYIWNFADTSSSDNNTFAPFDNNDIDPLKPSSKSVQVAYSWVNVNDSKNPVYYFTNRNSPTKIKDYICNNYVTKDCKDIELFNVSPVVSGSQIVEKYSNYNQILIDYQNYLSYKERKYSISSPDDRDLLEKRIIEYKIFEDNITLAKKYQLYNGTGFLNSKNVDNYKIRVDSGKKIYYFTDINEFLIKFGSSSTDQYFNFDSIKDKDTGQDIKIWNLPKQDPQGGPVKELVKKWNKNWLIANETNADLPKYNYKSMWAAFDPNFSYKDTFYSNIKINTKSYDFATKGLINDGRQIWNIDNVTYNLPGDTNYIAEVVGTTIDGSDNLDFKSEYFTDLITLLNTSIPSYQFTTLARPGDIILDIEGNKDYSEKFLDYINLGNIPRQYNKQDMQIKGRFPSQSDTKYVLDRVKNQNLFVNNPYLKTISYAVLDPKWDDIPRDSQENFDKWVSENIFNPDSTGHNTLLEPKVDKVIHTSLINGKSYFIINKNVTNPSIAINQFYDDYLYSTTAKFYKDDAEYELYFYFSKNSLVSDNSLSIPQFSTLRQNLNSLQPITPRPTPPTNTIPSTPMPSLINNANLLISDSIYGKDIEFSAFKSFQGWLWGRIEDGSFNPMPSNLIKNFKYISNGHLYTSIYDIPSSNISPISSVNLDLSSDVSFWDDVKKSDFYNINNNKITSNIIDLATRNSKYEVNLAKGLDIKENPALINIDRTLDEASSESVANKKKMFLYKGNFIAEELDLSSIKYGFSKDGNFSSDFSWTFEELENTDFFTSSNLISSATEEPYARSVINNSSGPKDFRFLNLPVIKKPESLEDKLIVKNAQDLVVYSIKPTSVGEKLVWQNPIDLSTLRFVDKDNIYYLELDKSNPSKYDDREISSLNIARSFLLEISEDIKVNDSVKNQLIVLIIAGSVLITAIVGSISYFSVYISRNISNRKKVTK